MRTVQSMLLVLGACANATEERALMLPDAGPADAPSPDADPTCRTTLPDPVGADSGRVGGTGGGKGPLLACDDVRGERIIGMALRMSDQATSFGGRSAHGIAIACAKVAILPDGTPQVGATSVREVSGSGAGMWSPSTWSSMTECQPGWVVTGLRAHLGADRNRFIDASIVCSKLGVDGTPAASETLKIAGSLTDAVNRDEVRCGADRVLAQLGTWTGAGIDAVDLACARPACR